MTIEIPKDKWTGKVRTVTIGAASSDGGTRSKAITIGGDTTMPFLHFESPTANSPILAIEIRSRKPDDWSALLENSWRESMNNPGSWAKAAEKAGAEMIVLWLTGEDTPEDAVNAVKQVLSETSVPLAVFGPGNIEKDNDLLVAVSEAAKGERLVLGICEDKNYRTIAATSMANGHIIVARTAMDVNLAKQLNILISDMGLPLDRVIMDPTTGALGYGMEYGFSVMERLRLAALQGDSMTQLPMMVTTGFETWKTKEAKVGTGVPESWGDWLERAIHWETTTSLALLESGAAIIVLRHPESINRVRMAISELMTA